MNCGTIDRAVSGRKEETAFPKNVFGQKQTFIRTVTRENFPDNRFDLEIVRGTGDESWCGRCRRISTRERRGYYFGVLIIAIFQIAIRIAVDRSRQR